MGLQHAIDLYEQKNYYACIEECLKTPQDSPYLRESCLLTAKSYLYLLCHPFDESDIDLVCTVTENAILACKSTKEVCDTAYDIKETFYQWEIEYFNHALKKLESNPCLEEFNAFNPCLVNSSKLNLSLQDATVHPYMDVLAKQEGLSLQEANDKYYRTPENKPPRDIFNAMRISSAQRIFLMIQQYIDNNYHSNAEQSKHVAKIAIDALSMLDVMISTTHSSTAIKQANIEEIADRFIFHAEVLTYLMNATLSLNGRTISIYQGDNRRQTYYQIETLYEKAQRYNPSFVIPQLPSIEAIIPKQGCYVATAVYGSYDCPEVWTLRRYRDDILASCLFGRAFIRAYYAISPTLVKCFGNTRWFRSLWKCKLDRLVSKLQRDGIESTPYQDKEW